MLSCNKGIVHDWQSILFQLILLRKIHNIWMRFGKTDSAYHRNGRFILIIGRAIPKNDDFSIGSCILQNNCVILHSIIEISIQL